MKRWNSRSVYKSYDLSSRCTRTKEAGLCHRRSSPLVGDSGGERDSSGLPLWWLDEQKAVPMSGHTPWSEIKHKKDQVEGCESCKYGYERSDDFHMCIDGEVYGPCKWETEDGHYCFGVCEPTGSCECICHPHDFCPLCSSAKPHGTFYAAGIWGYSCDPNMAGRDQGTSFRKVFDITRLPKDIQERMDAAEAAHQARAKK